jgi:hypothetical protein
MTPSDLTQALLCISMPIAFAIAINDILDLF